MRICNAVVVASLVTGSLALPGAGLSRGEKQAQSRRMSDLQRGGQARLALRLCRIQRVHQLPQRGAAVAHKALALRRQLEVLRHTLAHRLWDL